MDGQGLWGQQWGTKKKNCKHTHVKGSEHVQFEDPKQNKKLDEDSPPLWGAEETVTNNQIPLPLLSSTLLSLLPPSEAALRRQSDLCTPLRRNEKNYEMLTNKLADDTSVTPLSWDAYANICGQWCSAPTPDRRKYRNLSTAIQKPYHNVLQNIRDKRQGWVPETTTDGKTDEVDMFYLKCLTYDLDRTSSRYFQL